jgi:hypothetical protein
MEPATRRVIRLLLASLCFMPAAVHAQTAAAADAPVDPSGRVTLYVDCRDFVCDADYIRNEIPFVLHVRDRRDADVYVLITSETTAAGGRELRLAMTGQRGFAGLDDELRYVSPPAASEDQIREGVVKTIGRALVRYVSRTPLADELTVVHTASSSTSATPRDRWHRWTFALTANAYLNAEQSLASNSASASFSATRITEGFKINGSVQADYSSNSFEVAQGRSIESHQRSYGFTLLVAPSVGERVSVGVRASGVSSTFLNQRLTLRAASAVELNAFRYRDANRRMLTLEYSVGVTAYDYEERTIFGELSERLPTHHLLISLRLRQPWGSVGVGAEGSQYLHDRSKNRLIAGGNMDWNIVRGLSFVTFVHAAHINDQVFLPARGLSNEEILLRQRQLATSYSYSASIGFSYSFGSRFASVVNRRFSGSLGGLNFVQ